MDLSKHHFTVTFSHKYNAGDYTYTLIRLDEYKSFMVVHTKDVIKRFSKHRVLSVTRIKDHRGPKNLLQLAGDFYITFRTQITDEVFNKINRYQNYWLTRNESNSLQLYEYPKKDHSAEVAEDLEWNGENKMLLDYYLSFLTPEERGREFPYYYSS